MGSNIISPAAGDATGLSGIAHGGPNPVSGATVTLYATTSGGYGAAATQLATATTASNGGFSFTSPATCTAGQQAYITVKGGNPGSGTNANYLLMAALGDCSTVSSATAIWVDEVTTVAAAYALAPFITDTAGVVGISAPAANNSESPACTGTGSAMTCTAGGLKHAFMNALNLANSVTTTAGNPNGHAYTVTPSNSKGSVPAALINSLANAVESCVNSTGGVAGSATACGKLFTYATPPTASPTVPTDTLQALIDIAQYPTLTSSANITGLYNLSSPITFYQPQLSAAPADWSLAIVYSGVTVGGTTSSFGGIYNLATDIDDNVYADAYTSPNQYVSAMSSNGSGIFYNGTALGSTYTYARFLAPDTAGNLWVTNDASSAGALLKLSATTGALETNGTFTASAAVYGVAIDRDNNVYYTVSTASADNLYTIAAGGTTASAVTAGSTPTAVEETAGSPRYVGVDSSGNLWNVEYSTSSTDSYFVPNTGTISAPAFGSSPINTVESSTVGYIEGLVFDSVSHAWVNNDATLYELATPPAATSTASEAITSSQSGTTVTAYNTEPPAIDGANNIFLPDYNGATSYLWEYLPGISASTFVYLKPCAAPAGATTCNSGTTTGTFGAIYNPEQAVVDSTGSVWVANHSSDSIAQVLGVGTPAWPQLSYGHTGEPQ